MTYREYLLEILHGQIELLGTSDSEKRDAEALGAEFGIKAWWKDPKGKSKAQREAERCGNVFGEPWWKKPTDKVGLGNDMKTEVVMLPEKPVKADPVERVNRWAKVVKEVLETLGSPRGIKVTLGPKERLMVVSIQKELDRQSPGVEGAAGAKLKVQPATETIDGKVRPALHAFLLSAEVPKPGPEHPSQEKHAAD